MSRAGRGMWSTRGWSFAIAMVLAGLLPQVGSASDPIALQAASQALDAGEYHNCIVAEDASLQCWGSYGTLQSSPPTTGRFLAVSAGVDHTCALRSNGLAVCWGQNDSIATPPPLGPFVAVSAGQGENCALRPDGRLACWGGLMAGAAPTGAGYLDVSVAAYRGCAVRGDGTLQCWQPAGVPSLGPEPAGRYLSVAAGANHACALRSDGEAVCWGANADGQAAAPAGTRFVALSVGYQHSCGLREDGGIACWGINDNHQLSAPAGRFTALSAGRSHTCVRTVSGNVRCWGGSNNRNELTPQSINFASLDLGGGEICALDHSGNPTCADTAATALRPPVARYTHLNFGADAACGIGRDERVSCWGASLGATPTDAMTAVAVGANHACGLRKDLTVACWGDNTAGQATPPTGPFSHIVSGDGFSCGRRSDTSLACWGQGPAVTQVPQGAYFRTLDAHGGNACAVDIYGYAYCWGANAALLAPPVQAGTYSNIAVGDRHACVIRNAGYLYCWGDNASGQLALPAGFSYGVIAAAGDTTCAVSFSHGGAVCWGAATTTLRAPTSILQGGDLDAGTAHTCQLRANGGLDCWGDGSFGQLARPNGYQRAMDVDGDHACAIGASGGLSCWGDDTHGGATPESGPFRQAEMGLFNGCAVRGNGEAACWGWNVNGQSTPPVGAFRSVSTGLNHSCGLREDGTLACWGYDADGQATPPAGQFRAVAVGERHSCAIAGDGGLQCWGLGSEGQTTLPDLPGATYRALAVGAFHNCAIVAHGGLACWGRNDRGQATSPVEGHYVAVAAGFAHTCAIRDDGVRLCWGNSDQGQAPVPTIGPQSLPPAPAGGIDYAVDFQMLAGSYVPNAPKFLIVAGTPPSGLVLDENGRYSGRVDSPVGLYTFMLQARDDNGFQATRQMQLEVVDGMPPLIEPLFNGALTQESWYSGNVRLEWRLTDRQTPVTASVGCGAITISEDTNGTDYTCTATSAGGTSSRTVTIRRDATGPDTRFDSVPSLPQWGSGLYDVSFAFSMVGTDLSGLAGYECNITPLYASHYFPCTSPAVFTGLGTGVEYTLLVRAKDILGNVDPTPAMHRWTVLHDPTPPVIVPIFEAVLGDNGWYRSDVRLRWSITDPETPATPISNCHEQLVTVDTSTWLQPCIARSGGGEIWGWASIRRDATPPQISATSNSPNAAGWYNNSVTYTYTCFDWLSGVVSCPASETVSQEGVGLIVASKTIRDNAGNTAATLEQTHNIDRTPPVVVVTPIGTANNDGWYRDLTLQFSCSDALSGLANPCPWQLDVTTEGWSVSAGTNATDRAGNTTSSFATYKIDRSPPFFQFPSLPYPVRLNANLTVTLNATDHLSGVASASCTPLETATLGEKIMTCTAVDMAGNRNTMSAAYVVGYDIVPAAAPLGSSLSQAFLVSAPRSVPFLWSLRDANGVAVTNATLLRSSVTTVSCPATVVTLATPPAGETTTFENLGAGDYRRNWWINPTLAPNTCQRLDMVLDDGVTHSAIIKVVPKIRITGGPGQPTPQVTPVARPMSAAQRVPRAQQPIRRGVKPAKPRAR